MWRFYAAVGLVWLCLMPPLFTAGACTEAYENENRLVLKSQRELHSAQAAVEYFRSRGVPVSLITPERCREAKPRFLDRCGGSTLVYATVPVQNKVCALYRDDEVKIQLHYDDKGRLARFKTDMAPFKSLPIPFTSHAIHWAR